MREQIKSFLLEHHHYNEHMTNLSTSLVFNAYGGSRLHGLAEHDADHDIRCIAILNENYVYGLHRFEHLKMNNGEKGMTKGGDFDVEIFHYDAFFHRLLRGETTVIEMLFAPKQAVHFVDPIWEPVLAHRHLFQTTHAVHHYRGLIHKHFNTAQRKHFKKESKQELVARFGYETKELMKAILFIRIVKEFYLNGEFHFIRNEDKKELLDIKHGNLGSFREAEKFYEEELAQMKNAREMTKLPEYPDINAVNAFYIPFHKKILSYVSEKHPN